MIRTYTPNDILTLPGTIEGLFNGYRGRILYYDWEWVYVDPSRLAVMRKS